MTRLRPRLRAAAALLLLAGCTQGAEIRATVISSEEIRFEVVHAPQGFCLLSASIVREGEDAKDGGAALWELRRHNGSQAPCPTRFAFPAVPQGYDVLGKPIPLAPGPYRLGVDGGAGLGEARFTVP
ncbi:hypothetical protein HZY97_12270 [Sphingomonas sp. R-74633]|uniref:hypothetical protein n=1 Tax=Sphingomonas sp. R-74633 TaxID=2751188 RepID=UPI0015D1EB6D|nr:hypothetical protein [Sphingomonas sp. R-74633]NYT41538.1 hypothetical protein [Sphingomonas sp. R-74633]